MRVGFRLAPGLRRVGFGVALCGLAVGCEAGSGLAGSGVAVEPPPSWRPVAATTWPVPGTALAAWSGPEGSSLVVYRALPAPGSRAGAIAEGLTNRLTNLPGLTVVSRREERRAGREGARVEVVAPGTGDSLAPSGMGTPSAPQGRTLVATRRVIVAFALPSETLFLAWHAPESAYVPGGIREDIEATLGRLRIDAPRPRRSSY